MSSHIDDIIRAGHDVEVSISVLTESVQELLDRAVHMNQTHAYHIASISSGVVSWMILQV